MVCKFVLAYAFFFFKQQISPQNQAIIHTVASEYLTVTHVQQSVYLLHVLHLPGLWHSQTWDLCLLWPHLITKAWPPVRGCSIGTLDGIRLDAFNRFQFNIKKRERRSSAQVWDSVRPSAALYRFQTVNEFNISSKMWCGWLWEEWVARRYTRRMHMTSRCLFSSPLPSFFSQFLYSFSVCLSVCIYGWPQNGGNPASTSWKLGLQYEPPGLTFSSASSVIVWREYGLGGLFGNSL